VRVYTLDDLNTTEGQDALINLCDKYYPTLASIWAAYGKGLADVADAAALRETKLAYITNTLQRGSMVYYEVIPESIVITAPFLMNMTPTMSNASRFTQQQEGTPKYALYPVPERELPLDKLVAYKAAYIGTEAGKAAVTEYFSTGMYPTTLDGYCAAYGAPTSLELALNAQNAAGLKAQTTYIPE